MRRLFLLIIIFFFASQIVSAQTIWNGPIVAFSKEPYADWTLSENQDWITDNVQITRKNAMGIFNIALENGYQNLVSPIDTEWGMGSTDDLEQIEFSDWKTAVGANPQGAVDMSMVVHLITDDIYIDIRFTDWGGVNDGGSYGYKRRSPSVLSIENIGTQEIELFPNPGSNFFEIAGVNLGSRIEVYNHIGNRVHSLIYSGKVSTAQWAKGLYFIKIENNMVLKFIKI